MELGHGRTASAPFDRTKRRPPAARQAGKLDESIGPLSLGRKLRVLLGQVAVVLGFDRAALIGFHIVAGEDPIAAEGGQALFRGAGEARVAPGPGAIIDPNRRIRLAGAAEGGGVREGDLTHWDADGRMQRASDVNPLGSWQRRAGGIVAGGGGFRGWNGFFGADHGRLE